MAHDSCNSGKLFCFPGFFYFLQLIPVPPISLLPPNLGIDPGTNYPVFSFLATSVTSHQVLTKGTPTKEAKEAKDQEWCQLEVTRRALLARLSLSILVVGK